MGNGSAVLRAVAVAAAVGAAAPAVASATTWAPEDVACPLCGATNEFQGVMSFGTYVYNWPSKFQLVFWPYTDANVLYSCEDCKLTCFMSDFDDIPAEKHDAFRETLAEVDFGGDYATYVEIPMSARLAAAEKVYAAWGRDDDFWCHFWRVAGYHYEAEGKVEEAAEARRKALEIAETLMAEEKRAGERKEFLAIAGAMRHLTGDDAGALRDFEEALALTYENAELATDRNEDYDGYLTALLQEYVAKVEGGGEE
jgi:tetratricopeptide (TPR) repeat protein